MHLLASFPEVIAMFCHEVNKIFCGMNKDHSQPRWIDAQGWQKESAINGVKFHLSGEYGKESSHENWMKEKIAAGWTYGPEKSPELKTHPCLIPFDQLPKFQQIKDVLFSLVVGYYKYFGEDLFEEGKEDLWPWLPTTMPDGDKIPSGLVLMTGFGGAWNLVYYKEDLGSALGISHEDLFETLVNIGFTHYTVIDFKLDQ